MTEQEAEKAVKEDIEAIAKASDDQEDKLTAMLVGFSDLLVNQTIDAHRGEASDKKLAIYAMAGLIKTLIDKEELNEVPISELYKAMKMKTSKDNADAFDRLFF